mmetsp:Transcript_9282/g.30648  ORF Transcript_9282/g.30648 Transcript_9282/m.30648 type:complete len:220 (-) Transcript_9282:12-671(-)
MMKMKAAIANGVATTMSGIAIGIIIISPVLGSRSCISTGDATMRNAARVINAIALDKIMKKVRIGDSFGSRGWRWSIVRSDRSPPRMMSFEMRSVVVPSTLFSGDGVAREGNCQIAAGIWRNSPKLVVRPTPISVHEASCLIGISPNTTMLIPMRLRMELIKRKLAKVAMWPERLATSPNTPRVTLNRLIPAPANISTRPRLLRVCGRVVDTIISTTRR